MFFVDSPRSAESRDRQDMPEESRELQDYREDFF